MGNFATQTVSLKSNLGLHGIVFSISGVECRESDSGTRCVLAVETNPTRTPQLYRRPGPPAPEQRDYHEAMVHQFGNSSTGRNELSRPGLIPTHHEHISSSIMPRKARIHFVSLRSSLVNLPISIYGPLLERGIVSCRPRRFVLL